MVQRAIVKIKKSMETIFGPLGNSIIQNKMQGGQTICENINESMETSLCAFVVCRINHLSTITEVLGDEVFGFIN
jgi:hypothetical protein